MCRAAVVHLSGVITCLRTSKRPISKRSLLEPQTEYQLPTEISQSSQLKRDSLANRAIY